MSVPVIKEIVSVKSNISAEELEKRDAAIYAGAQYASCGNGPFDNMNGCCYKD
ncbi:MAG: hypothetical protein ACI4B6_07445 [Atopobiaceae bacterium]